MSPATHPTPPRSAGPGLRCRRPRRWAAAALAALGLAVAALAVPPLAARDVVIYRCTGADGAVTLQNGRPCAKGQREQRRVLAAPAPPATPPASPVPAAVSPPPSIAPMPGAAARRPEVVDEAVPTIEMGRAPAPPVFACRTWDGQRYFGDTDRPAPRCAPLQAVGLDRRTPSAAQACEMRLDSCEPVLDAARCEAWASRLRDVEARASFGDAVEAEAARTELGRIRTLLAGTVCAR